MTNREWINSLSDEDFVKWLMGKYPIKGTIGENKTEITLFDGYERIKFSSSSTYTALIDFLKEIHEE